MTASYRTRNGLLIGVNESPAGTEGAPTPGSNAIKTRQGVGFSPSFDANETDYLQESLSQSAPIIGGGFVGMQVPAYLKGSGTAGVAPDFGPLLRACGFSETLTASAVTGTAQAGAAGSVTLASGASSTTDIYKGMVLGITSGTGSGQERVVTGYNGSSKVATVMPDWDTPPDNASVYTIAKNVLYRPISQSLEAVTLWHYQRPDTSGGNARRRRLKAGAASMALRVAPRGFCSIDFRVTGQLPAVPDDISDPGAPTFQSTDPPVLLGAKAYLGAGVAQFSEWSFDLGNDLAMFDDPAAAYGYDIGAVLNRRPSGRIVPNLVATSSRDAFSDWLASTSRAFWLSWGATVGNKISLFQPALRYTGNEPGDVRGFATEGLPFRSTTPDGELYICLR